MNATKYLKKAIEEIKATTAGERHEIWAEGYEKGFKEGQEYVRGLELKHAKEEAYTQGRDEGYEKGLRDGYEKYGDGKSFVNT